MIVIACTASLLKSALRWVAHDGEAGSGQAHALQTARGMRCLVFHLACAALATLASCSSQIGGSDPAAKVDAAIADAQAIDAASDRPVPERLGYTDDTGTEGLNLRSAPDGEILVVVPDGSLVEIVSGPDDGWYQLRIAGILGFASDFYIREIDLDNELGFLNLLPWEAGASFEVAQGHGADALDHTGKAKFAWDFNLPIGTKVYATHGGVVRTSRSDGGEGCCDESCEDTMNWVVIERGDGYESAYLHLSDVLVEEGGLVERGDVIAHSGSSGFACAPHLHYQLQKTPSSSSDDYETQSVQSYFYDTGKPVDPVLGQRLESQNGTLAVP